MNDAETQSTILVPRIFVSHSGKDDTFGSRLVKDLRNAFRDEDAVWYDRMGGAYGGGLVPGESWWDSIKQQIIARYFFLLIMSPEAFASNWVKDEIKIAWQEKNRDRKYIIPIYYRTCDIDPDIRTLQYIDFRDSDDASKPRAYLDALDKLLAFLEKKGMRAGMDDGGIRRSHLELKEPASDHTNAQEKPETIIQQLFPPIQDAFRRSNWPQVLQDSQGLIKRATGAIPSELYEMQGLAALHLGNTRLAEEALQTFLAQKGDTGQCLALLLKYIQFLHTQNQADLVRQYTYKFMDIARDDPTWFKKVLHHLSRLVPSNIEIIPDDDLPPSYLSHTHTYRYHTGEIYTIAWSPDNRYIASAGADRTLQVWEPIIRKSNPVASCAHANMVRSVDWGPTDGAWRYLATACDDHTIYIWRIIPTSNQQELVTRLAGHHDCVRSVAWSPDGKSLASGSDDGTVRIWSLSIEDMRNQRSEQNQKSDQKPICVFKHLSWVNAVAWSPHKEKLDDEDQKDAKYEHKYVASASNDRTVKIWDIETEACRYTYQGHQKAVNDLIWSPNGATIASASSDKTVQVWEYNTGNRGTTYRQHSDSVVSLARSPYGRRIVSSSKNSFHLWYAATGDSILSNPLYVGWIRKVAWSPDGLFIALTGEEEHAVQVWRVASSDL